MITILFAGLTKAKGMMQETESKNRIRFDNLNFLLLDPSKPFNTDRLEGYDAVLIQYSNHIDIQRIIDAIRSHNEKAIYLIPIFLLSMAENMDSTTVELADGVVSNSTNLDSAAAITHKIKSRR